MAKDAQISASQPQQPQSSHFSHSMEATPLTITIILIAATLGVFSIRWLLWFLLHHLVTFLLAFLGFAAFAVFWTVYDSCPAQPAPQNTPLFRRFKFTLPEVWENEISALKSGNNAENTEISISNLGEIVSGNPQLSARLGHLIDLVITSFITPWLSRLTDDPSVPSECRAALSEAIGALASRARLQYVDLPAFLVFRVIPIVSSHFSLFVEADSHVRASATKGDLTESEELNQAVAEQFGKLKASKTAPPSATLLHPAISQSRNPAALQKSQKAWLRRVAQAVLPLLLAESSVGSPALQARAVFVLLRELIAGAVVYPVMTSVSEPDFYNQQILRLTSAALQDRQQVRRLRAALDEHAGELPGVAGVSEVPGSSGGRSVAERPAVVALPPDMDSAAFERAYRHFTSLTNLAQLRQSRYHVTVQLRRAQRDVRANPQYVAQLQELKTAVETRLREVSGRASGAAGGTAGTSATNSAAAAASVSASASAASVSAANAASNAAASTPVDPREQMTLRDVLSDPAALAYFMEFMEQHRRITLLQYWSTVDGIRNPLEPASGTEPVSHSLGLTGSGSGSGSGIRGGDEPHPRHTRRNRRPLLGDIPEADVSSDASTASATSKYSSEPPDLGDSLALSVLSDMSNAQDIQQIYHTYFQLSQLKLRADVVDAVASFVEALETESAESAEPGNPLESAEQAEPSRRVQRLYIRARARLLESQDDVFRRMARKDLPAFKRSDLFLKYLAYENPEEGGEGGEKAGKGGDGGVEVQKLEDSGIDGLNGASGPNGTQIPVGDTVVQAVEDAFNEIMSTDTSKHPGSSSEASGEFRPARRSEKQQLEDYLRGAPGVPDYWSLSAGEGGEGSTAAGSPADSAENLGGFLPMSRRPPLSLGTVSSATATSDDSDSNAELSSDADRSSASVSASASASGSTTELHFAAPGDLGLSEAIKQLTADIDKLRRQESVLDQLINKAELTNNTSELRILRKSKTSLNQELRSKELQKQQYEVQESDSSLYGRSRIRIQSYVTEKGPDGRDYVVYVIEVQRFASDGTVRAGWLVGRRYSQFYRLHQHLRSHPQVRRLEFPRKRVVLKFQQRSFAESRRAALEKYLQDLLEIPEVCQSRAFRSFLSSESFSIPAGEERGKWGASFAASALAGSLAGTSASASASASDFSTVQSEMQQELESFDKKDQSFAKPICDLFTAVFGLSRAGSGFRGRAVLIILQQILGGTIERLVRDQVAAWRSETRMADLVESVVGKLWDDKGNFIAGSEPRTRGEKSSTKQKARQQLELLMVDSFARVIGGSSSRYAARMLFQMVQNPILNAHLAYEMLDEVVVLLFPEVVEELQIGR